MFFYSYAALGLQFALTPTQSGGVERTLVPPKASADVESVSAAPKSVESGPSVIPKGFGRIIRDESGNVIRIDLAESEEIQNTVQKTELPEADVDEKTMGDWVGCLNKIHHPNRTMDAREISSSCAQGTHAIDSECRYQNKCSRGLEFNAFWRKTQFSMISIRETILYLMSSWDLFVWCLRH